MQRRETQSSGIRTHAACPLRRLYCVATRPLPGSGSLLADGRWLNDYFEPRILAARTANDPVDAFVPIADINRLEQAWVGSAPSPGALAYEPSVEARLQAILQSRSWRATAPLRAATTAFRLWRAWFAEWVNLPIRDQLRALIALIGNFSAISKIRS